VGFEPGPAKPAGSQCFCKVRLRALWSTPSAVPFDRYGEFAPRRIRPPLRPGGIRKAPPRPGRSRTARTHVCGIPILCCSIKAKASSDPLRIANGFTTLASPTPNLCRPTVTRTAGALFLGSSGAGIDRPASDHRVLDLTSRTRGIGGPASARDAVRRAFAGAALSYGQAPAAGWRGRHASAVPGGGPAHRAYAPLLGFARAHAVGDRGSCCRS